MSESSESSLQFRNSETGQVVSGAVKLSSSDEEEEPEEVELEYSQLVEQR